MSKRTQPEMSIVLLRAINRVFKQNLSIKADHCQHFLSKQPFCILCIFPQLW